MSTPSTRSWIGGAIRSKRVLALTGVLVIVTLTWMLSRGARRAALPVDVAVQAPSAVSSTESPAELTPATASNDSTRTEVVSTPVVTPAAIPSGQITIHGNVVVLDALGVEHASENGTIKLTVWRGRKGVAASADVVAGRYTFALDPCDGIEGDEGFLGNRNAYDLSQTGKRSVPPEGRMDWQLTWPPALVVHARDAETNRDLTRLEVVASMDPGHDTLLIPRMTRGSGTAVLEGDSPLTIRAEDLRDAPFGRTLYVRAPGYAWEHVAFDRRKGGDLFAELVPGCGLDVDVTGDDIAKEALLRLSTERVFERVEMHIGAKRQFAIDGVRAGKYTLSAQIGHVFDNPVTLGEVSVELQVGKRERVQLALKPAPIVERAGFTGVLIVPKIWNVDRPGLTATLLAAPSRSGASLARIQLQPAVDSIDTRSYAWSIEDLATGVYEFGSLDPLFVATAELVPGGTSNVRIEIPPPAEVHLRVVDAATNERVIIDSITWRPRPPKGSIGGRIEKVDRNEASGEFLFRCPVGEIGIQTGPGVLSGFSRGHVFTKVRLGVNEVEMRLERSARISVRVLDGEKAYVHSDIGGNSSLFDFKEVNGDGHLIGSRSSGASLSVDLTRPGLYLVRMPKPIPGFERFVEQTIDVKGGEDNELVVRLQRRP